MTSGNWNNSDGLFLQFGTSKATAETAGEYQFYGPNRIVEVKVDMTKLTSTAVIQSNTTFFPINTLAFIEKVEVVNEIGSVGGTSMNVGIMQLDRATIPAGGNIAFVNALINATTGTAGFVTTIFSNSTSNGSYIGDYLGNLANATADASANGPWYITAQSSGTYTAGLVLVRIFYHGAGLITN